MTQFEQLELIYNQFLNLTAEIDKMIEKEDYKAAAGKTEYKNKLIKKISNVRKTVNFTDEEIEKARLIEQKIKEKEQETFTLLKKLQNQLGEEINNTKKKIKINTAYIVKSDEKHGAFIDISD